MEVAFFTISDAGYATGTIGLVNSLRLLGHDEPIVILDCGLSEGQRRLLLSEATLVPWDRSAATNPTLFKPFAHLTDPTGVVVLIDSDVVVTARLDEIIKRAANGAICAFPDPEDERTFAEWQSIFGLPSSPRAQPYANAGFVAISAEHHPTFLAQWWDACRLIWAEPTIAEGTPDGPTSQADQDALNALLMTVVQRESITFLDQDLAPAHGAMEEGVQVHDELTLACSFRGKQTLLLHNAGRAKPWRQRDWPYVRPTAYARLLRRCLAAKDVRLKIDPGEVPPWLRPGRVGRTWYVVATAQASLAYRIAMLPIVHPVARRARALARQARAR